MDKLILILESTQTTIQKGLVNFKKSPRDRLTLEYMETRLELLEKDWAKYQEYNTKLYETYDELETETLVDMYDSTEETYVSYKCLIKTLLNKCKSSMELENRVKDEPKSTKPPVKLVRISLPTFSGKYEEWTTFHDLFKSLVHTNDTLDNVEKLHYLKIHLSGEPAQLLRQTPTTDANYSKCWALLEKRYNNKRYITSNILNRFLSQKRIHTESAKSLRELLDTTCDCLGALSTLDIDVSTWDAIIIHIVAYKLDNETRKQWELSVSSDSTSDLPALEEFKVFLENRFRALETIESTKPRVHRFSNKSDAQAHTPKAMVATRSKNTQCEYCSEAHKLCFCKGFAKQPIEKRREFVKEHRMCFNCLGGNHTSYDCKKLTTCKVCQRRHHSLLHLGRELENGDQTTTTKPAMDSASASTSTSPIVSCLSTGKIPKPRLVLLATALINVESITGQYQPIRALLDQGSQACFITEATVQLLRLKKIPIQGLISGLGDNRSTIAKHMVHLSLQSRVSPDFKLKVKAYVLRKITSYLPERSIDTTMDWLGVTSLQLADPGFNRPNKVDILLGADAYSSIITDGVLKSPSGNMIAQNTTLGWVLSGIISTENNENTHISVMHAQVCEDEVLKKFWEIEELKGSKKILTPEETKCEELYSTTTTRDGQGRYIVRLPFRDDHPPCTSGNSRTIAEKRLKSLEKRLEHNKDLKEKYTQVIKEYLSLGHMRPVSKDDGNKEIAVYLPHHAVIRDDKATTKVRVVFNASEKNRNGISLNDTLMVGPTLQSDLRHTVLRWRTQPIALVADIIKMYRQIKIADQDTMYQRILWRASPEMKIEDYELTTVTFGTASAPYQAVRTLHQVAHDEGQLYPLAKDIVLNCFYIDDAMAGCHSVEDGIEIYQQMTALLGKGGFKLQKWSSNNRTLVERITTMENNEDIEQIDQPIKKGYLNKDILIHKKEDTMKGFTDNKLEGKGDNIEVNIKLDSTIKILGLTWNRNEDSFQYSVNLPPLTTGPVTKRTIISEIARLFDPLGWVAPSVVMAKMFIQKLWLAGVGWDEELNSDIKKEWNTYREEMMLLTDVRIPRWLGTKKSDYLELHGFSDASKTAYAAVIYLRVLDAGGNVHVTLVVSKTRVAPVKQISIPRLELCGAVLLSHLLKETAEVLGIDQDRIKAWTDSTVVLAWLKSHPSRWKTFVANRTSEILNTMKTSQWHHVSTNHNPADCASRGMLPSGLRTNNMWFSGPLFLRKEPIIYSKPMDYNVNLEESTKIHVAIVPSCSLFEQYSTLGKLMRIVAYCRRFLKQNAKYHNMYLQKVELDAALECCIRATQIDVFTKEHKQLQDQGCLELKTSVLKSLCPYLDDRGIMRVRGRIEKAPISEQAKHPIVLPHSSHLTTLIIADAHRMTLHGGPQLMMCFLRTAYWVIGVRSLVKQHVRKCVTCARQRAAVKSQLMGSLPAVRCTPARPFLHSGVDYAGPINIRTTKGRGHRSHKGYICLFVCMATRALHLEVVSDMTTQAFLAAFRRFVSRRGHCAKLWSDNGTTFVGASRELHNLSSIQSSAAQHLETTGTEWHFIPPHSPNFGGLWEAGVKSTKFHLKRVIGDSTLTYEEMSTLLSQVEACLNSRPMSVINVTDPGEPLPLTPGHFLIGEPLVSVPANRYDDSSLSSLTRWQFIQKMLQSFWKRWYQEYLSNLMNRYKWSSQVPEPNIGDIVLVKEDDMPPSHWLLGRVLKRYPGDDGITRVVTLRTKSSTIKRPTSKLCILPITSN